MNSSCTSIWGQHRSQMCSLLQRTAVLNNGFTIWVARRTEKQLSTSKSGEDWPWVISIWLNRARSQSITIALSIEAVWRIHRIRIHKSSGMNWKCPRRRNGSTKEIAIWHQPGESIAEMVQKWGPKSLKLMTSTSCSTNWERKDNNWVTTICCQLEEPQDAERTREISWARQIKDRVQLRLQTRVIPPTKSRAVSTI